MNSAEKLESLRDAMVQQGLDGFIVPRTDEYQGEYVPEGAERLKWLTGFTGSAGCALILADKAMVMSDSRYTIQLPSQVDTALYDCANSQEIKMGDWFNKNTKKGAVMGYDPKLHTFEQVAALEKAKIDLKPLPQNLIDAVWRDRPSAPSSKVEIFPEEYAGLSAFDKVSHICAEIEKADADALVLSLSDSIAWLLNIRAQDVTHIPVALSYAIITKQGAVRWYIDEGRLDSAVKGALPADVKIHPASHIDLGLKALSGQKVMIDPKRSSVWFDNMLNFSGASVVHAKDPCIDIRARKTDAEQAAMKNAHIRDGAAMVQFLKWFEENAPIGALTELSVEEKLNEIRARAPEFRDTSFDTIAGFNGNGAIVHYRATAKSNQTLKQGGLLLLDSGAQYCDGTTDITRTLSVGAVSSEIIKHNTYVLKAHIALAMAVFKKGTLGKKLDAICRAPMKKVRLDYGHGTGHGVGCYLSVHEEAVKGISPRADAPIEAGMILSNEPGYYKENAYGIRIENLILTREQDDKHLSFETITLCPLDKTIINESLLEPIEQAWVNDYHLRVQQTLSPFLDEAHQEWLRQACAPL